MQHSASLFGRPYAQKYMSMTRAKPGDLFITSAHIAVTNRDLPRRPGLRSVTLPIMACVKLHNDETKSPMKSRLQ